MGTIIGIEKAYVAKQTQDNASGLIYGTPAYYAGIQQLGIKPKTSVDKQYAENKLWDQTTTFDSADVEMLIAALTNAERADILGQTIAAIGGVYAKDTDIAPYVAILYKANMRGGGFRYGVLYKGAFSIPEDNYKGKEGKTEFQSPKLTAVFQPTVFNGMWEYHVDTTDPNCPANIDTTWFTAVTVPTVDSTAPTVTVVPADAATGVLGTANIVFTFSKALYPADITDSNFFLLKAGVATACALTYDADVKVVTLDPTVSMTTGTYTAICTKSVRSATGVNLAANKAVTFTV